MASVKKPDGATDASGTTNRIGAAGNVDYTEFLSTKRIKVPDAGFDVEQVNDSLFGFQKDIVRWALRKGRAAVFADTGLGKTAMQLEWAHRVYRHTGGDVLILAPLAVGAQTAREGEKFGIPVTLCRDASDVRPGINVTNYERLHHFGPEGFAGLVLDESSILKGFDGKTRRSITDFGSKIDYRLACTATPAPNDLDELANHSEFLGLMSGKEMLAMFFVQDGNTTHKWRLKHHARSDFWRWVASWALAVRRPSDLGHDDNGFILPALEMRELITGAATISDDRLFEVEARTMDERRKARRESVEDRVRAAADLVAAEPDEPWLLWCGLNKESEMLAKAIPGAVEVRGSDKPEYKEKALLDFSEGRIKVLVTKPSIAGHGMNWQHCARVAFVGLSDSFEQLYQATRRCWRYGQKRPVHCYLVTAENEGAVVENIQRKERQARQMMEEIVAHTAQGVSRNEPYMEDDRAGEKWTLKLGDCVERIAEIEDESVGLTVFSPPFPGMYAYTDSPRDMGNVKSLDEMISHFQYLMSELLRVTMPGRSCAIHLTQAVAFKGSDGYSGLKDYRGRVIASMEEAGWIYYGEVCIEKDPQVKAIRTKDHGLMFKSLANDSSKMHMALADYMLQFRKPGENPEPIRAGVSKRYGNPEGWITQQEWIEWASPVWYRHRDGVQGGIRETNVLNVKAARTEKDERHLCPLQLDVIERAIKLWSNPGDTVLDPFSGICSTGHEAIKHNRRFIGIELKRSYFEQGVRNLEAAEAAAGVGNLLEMAE